MNKMLIMTRSDEVLYHRSAVQFEIYDTNPEKQIAPPLDYTQNK